MNYTSLIKAAVLSSLCAASIARGQSEGAASRLGTNDPPSLNRISVAYRMGFQMNAKFKRLGGLLAKSNPGPATGTGQVHNYDDGYILPDSRQVDDHFTWNWGFNSPSQVQPGEGTPYGFLLLHSSSSPPTATSHQDEDPQHGFEITYNRQLGMIRNWRWGLESAFNFSDLTVHDNSALKHTAERTTDTYSLDGLNPYAPPPAPPNTPYMGTPGGGYPGGGGPLISDIPVRRVTEAIPGGATITGSRTFEAIAYGLRLGPYLEAPIGNRFTVSFSGGLALALVDSELRFKETVNVPGVGTTTRSGSGSHSDLMAGWYVSGGFSYALSDSVGLFAAVQYQDVGLYKETEKRKQAQLELGGNIFLSLGVSFSF
jgi:opacity protein-like surface antigen